MRVKALAAAAALCLGLSLGGCISLFPKTTPAQLYSFGDSGPSNATASGGQTVNVLRAATSFPLAIGSDRILTTNGEEAAYIGGSRWVSPAAVLFDQAETRAFDQSAGPVRLLEPGEMGSAAAELRLEVQRFEVRYPGSMTAAPAVVVRVRAVLTGLGAGHGIAVNTFESRQQTQENRVGDIVTGFDAATSDVLNQIVSWTDAQIAQTQPTG